MVKIEIFGVNNCQTCDGLLRLAVKIAEEKGIPARCIKVADYPSMMAAGIMSMPGVRINGEMKVQGQVPSRETLTKWIEEAAAAK